MAEPDELTRALGEAVADLARAASTDPAHPDRLSQAGATAIASLRSFAAHPASRQPPAGSADPLRDARHDVRAAAQTVLAQLELISLAWPSWDKATRDEVVEELEDAGRELSRQVRVCTGEAP